VKVLGAIALLWFTALAAGAPAPLVLIALDGFRWDYPARYPAEAPNLRRLASQGVTARSLVPAFPSNTFANHYTIVTGLRPSRHGIINNHFFDQASGDFFHGNQPATARQSRWWGGEPIWVTAVRQGRRSATSFWPGSEAEIAGHRPTYWKPYDYSIPFESRLAELIGWLKQPPEARPAIVTFYLEETNSAGHRAGPDSPELAAAVKLLDDRIGLLTQRLADEGIDANLVIVSDHGMTACGPDRVVLFDDFIDPDTVQIDFDESVAGLRPKPGTDEAGLLEALRRMPHVTVHRAADLPPRLHVDVTNPRTPPIWILPDEGWNVMRRSLFNAVLTRFSKGQHGYDPTLPSMHGILIASGPAFRTGVVTGSVENIHIYNLLCAALGLQPAPNDGDNRLVEAALAPPR
jgi:predicted AlkP superfamily pyrophosphatase or phosphodiesterase